ncbi:MAG: 50S ribosomal protein L17 [Opitutales bacterium]|nr:50S ribosomal protein L17 [Opitutales bacterium]
MRHQKHNHTLGVKKEHREALLANLTTALLTHDRIETTLAKARALRPFAEKVITLAKKAYTVEAPEQKLHFRRLALARVRDESVVKSLFDEKVESFLKRNGGYTRIYKLVPRYSDASKMAIIELVAADDTGHKKPRRRGAKKAKAPAEEAVA